jgi:hypothetical protein
MRRYLRPFAFIISAALGLVLSVRFAQALTASDLRVSVNEADLLSVRIDEHYPVAAKFRRKL